jgi:CBS domain-containing protein
MEDTYRKRLQEPVTEVMISCPLPVSPDASLPIVLEHYSRQSNHPLIIISPDGTLTGVITPMGLISALIPGNGAGGRYLISELDRLLKSTAQSARDLISDEPLTVPDHATIKDALLAMEHGHSSSVIIVNPKNEPVGCTDLAGIISFLFHLPSP